MKKLTTVLLAAALIIALCTGAIADKLTIKPVADPWDDPENLISDGGTYYAYNDAGYIVAWETPECNVEREYLLLNNGRALTVQYRVSYMSGIPWGYVQVDRIENDELPDDIFSGWVLMTDLINADGEPVFSSEPEPTADPEPQPTPESSDSTPSRPNEAITVGQTYNKAIVYTSVAIAVAALSAVAYLLLKHKAVNKKGE